MNRFLICAALAFALAGNAAAQPSHKVQELVAPIALYPDVLVAQMLAASTHPDEVVHARLWLEAHHFANAQELAQAVDGEAWAPDIKALTLLSPVLDAMRRNFAWTAALGEAYTDAPDEVLGAVQSVRRDALAAGALKSTSEQNVITQGDTILIQPANAERAYVPGGGVFDVAVFERFAWGWHGWEVNWQQGAVRYQDAPYLSLR
ncbi:MAG TPA: DUF3300 domain-containing protein [Burkholderiales bacterium]|nr:DUF3300 domain-containing protein [Burkholderiales bacterium]